MPSTPSLRPVVLTAYSDLEHSLGDNNMHPMLADSGQMLSVTSNSNMFQHVVESNEPTPTVMVPVTFENCPPPPAVRISLPALNMPSRFLPEIDHSAGGYNLPCLLAPQGHPLIRHEGGYILPPNVITEEAGAVVNTTTPHQILQDLPQPLITSRLHPVQVPLSTDNLGVYRLPNLSNAAGRKPNNGEEQPEDPRLPSRLVRLEGPSATGLRNNAFRSNRDGTNGFSDS